VLKGKMSAILKRHCYHSNGDDVIFVNNFQLLEDCSIYVVQFLFSNKKPLFEKLNLNHDFVIFQKLQGATLMARPEFLSLDQWKDLVYVSQISRENGPHSNFI
jgi:GR25 family glycosyltransferase involved in LPS biosynthesis